nr:E-beta-farnesene synthase [Tanacetum cinerariifolium]
ESLQITPIDNHNSFSSPPTPGVLINFVNDMGYPKVVRTLSTVVTKDMHQPWRAVTTIINLCLTGKTSMFERPRALMLQIMFTKLIIHHLQSKHKFHPRPDSPLHLPYKEYVLGYLKFSAKGTKQEVFGMPILNELITDDIRDEFVDEGVHENEPRFDDEEANLQRVVEESLKDVHATHRGPLPPVVFGEPDSGRRQPLPEVQGKRTPETADPTGPSTHHEDEKATRADVETDAEELLTHAEKSGEEMSNIVVLGTESSEQDEKQGGPDPGDSTDSRPLPSQEILTENKKTTAKTKAESMVSVTIQQDTSAIHPMTTPVIDLTSRPDSPNVHQPLPATATETTTKTTTTHPPPPQPQQSTTYSILIKRIGKLKQIMENLIQDNKHLEERLDSHESRLYKLENLDIPQHVSKTIDEIVTDAVD